MKGRHAQRAVCAVFVALMAGLPAGAESPPATASRVLVMPFSVQAEASVPGGVAASRWLGEAAASLLGDELSALGLSALPRDGRVAVFDQLRVPMSSELTRATMIRIGELIGASEIVFGDVRMGSSLVVRARTIQLTGGRHLPDVLETGELSGIYDLFRRVGVQVARNTGRTLGAPGARPVPLPLLTLESYIKGLMAATPPAQQRFLESAMSQSPRDGRILTALWTVYTDQDLHEKALAVASAVPADSPQYRHARFSVALSLIELKRLDGAFKELTSLHTNRRSGAVSNALGIVQLRRGTAATPAAAYYFERAANEDPGQTDYLFNLGYARALAADTAGALTWLREVVRHQSGDGDAHLVMASVLGGAGRHAEALRELELARLLGTTLETVPGAPPKVPAGLERVRTSPDDSPIGVQALAAPAQRDQIETARFHLERARALSGGGQDREAVTELRRSIYLAPYEDEPHLLLGRLYQRGGRLGDAIDEFKVAIWCRETAAARIALGHALVSTGDRTAARVEFERALALAPDSAEAREALRKIGG